jgi:hypothetical protein
MSFTLGLALWGAVTGTVGTIVALLNFLRDRPNLHLGLTTRMERGYTPEIIAEVKNRGRQPTTIMDVELVSEGRVEIQKGGVTIATGLFTLGLADEEPRVVKPGEVARFPVSLSRWPGPVHADEPLRLHVVDSHERETWGPAIPVLRVFLNAGWQPPGADEDVTAPLPDAPIRPSAVEPRWKLWKSRELRRPSRPPPHAGPPSGSTGEDDRT